MECDEKSNQMKEWSKEEVKEFLLSNGVSEKNTQKLFNQELDGQMLNEFQLKQFEEGLELPKAVAVQIVMKRDAFLSGKKTVKKRKGERQIVREFLNPVPANFSYRQGNYIDQGKCSKTIFL